ncbi:MAG: nucleotidyl transferase AbiEii/AbiGii toxin family protein [Acidobacteriota bacterium]|nr:nucleotidyl transferase AbiEii/AbiGii toxin family protein [Acidobacteriota bacterium]
MADAFLSLPAADRRDILETADARSGRPAVILEKDVWICRVLQVLFSMPDPHPMAFKGGTSLSKVYRIIDRFSEDVDITLDYRAFEDGFDPFAEGVSRSAIRRFSDGLKSRVERYTRDVVGPALEAAAADLPASGRPAIRIDEGGERVRLAYPSAVENPLAYLASEVLLEFGGRNVVDPNERHEIVPDLAALSDGLEYPKATVTVLSPARTFWEKATLIHVECHRGRLAASPRRLSRHWFDLACLARHDAGRAALADRALLEDVVRHKTVFFNASYAHYDHCLDGRLRLVPDGDGLAGLRSDYDAMRQAGIVGATAPEFDAMIERLRALEAAANRPG